MESRDEIARELKRFLETEFPKEDVELTNATNLLDDWFVDSLGIVNTVLFLESAFGITMSRADINGQNFATIDALASLVLSRLGA